jgi:hypothetical protein
MYAKPLELSLLATVALLCALAAWIVDDAVFGSVFLVFCAVAMFGAARHWR